MAGESRFENDLYRRGGETNPVSTAEAGARVAESLGVPRSDIIVLDRPKDTEEEALAVKRAIGDAPFLLVTSASHLPRAMIFFSPCRHGSASRAGQSAGGDLAAQSVGAGHSFSSVADAQRPGRL